MVYMSGSKAARNQAAIINRGNTCGGPKKAGLSYTGVGPTKGSKAGTLYIRCVNTRFGAKCNTPTTLNPVQQTGYRATLLPM
jgi:hypothetical protein